MHSFALTGTLTILIGAVVTLLCIFNPDLLITWAGGIAVITGALFGVAGFVAKMRE